MSDKSKFNWVLFGKVILGHLCFLTFLFVVFQLQSCRKKESQIINAKLITLPRPAPESTVVDVAPVEKPQEKRVKSSKVNANKSKTGSEPKTRDQSVAKKPIRYRTPEEIRKSRLTPAKNEMHSRSKATSARLRNINVDEFQHRLAEKVNTHIPNTAYEPDWESNYHQLLINQLYKQWQQPTKTEVNDPHLTVKVMLEIDKSGRILQKKTIQSSNDPVMDHSVKRLLQELDRFPPFPETTNANSMTKVIVLKLMNNPG